jgi:predicted nucleotidyltransferase
MPGRYAESSCRLTATRRVTLNIWAIPQEAFQPAIEAFWSALRFDDDGRYFEDVVAVALYGSVARGHADRDSDIDVLVLTDSESSRAAVSERFGSMRLDVGPRSTIVSAEVFTTNEYRDAIERGSHFLERVRDEQHVIYDPEGVLHHPETMVGDE